MTVTLPRSKAINCWRLTPLLESRLESPTWRLASPTHRLLSTFALRTWLSSDILTLMTFPFDHTFLRFAGSTTITKFPTANGLAFSNHFDLHVRIGKYSAKYLFQNYWSYCCEHSQLSFTKTPSSRYRAKGFKPFELPTRKWFRVIADSFSFSKGTYVSGRVLIMFPISPIILCRVSSFPSASHIWRWGWVKI